MASVSVTNTFSNGATITAAGFNTNFSDLVTYINNRNDGSSTWDAVRVTTSSAVPLICNNSSGTSAIAQFNDNGTTIFSVNDSGENPITLNATSATGPYIKLTEAGVSRWTFGHDLNQSTDDFVFRDETNSVNKLIIDSATDGSTIIVNTGSTNGPFIKLTEGGTARWTFGHDLGQSTDNYVLRDETNSRNPLIVGGTTNGVALTVNNGSSTGSIFIAQDNGTAAFTVADAGNVVIGNAALATNATDGFLYVPSCAGAPSGTPTAFTGRLALVYDSSNNRLYVYNTAWKQVALA